MIAVQGMLGWLARLAGRVPRPVRGAVAALGMAVVLGTVSASPRSAESAAEPVTKAERAGLAGVHRTAVEIFIDRPGFGIRRMMLPLEDIVKAPKSLSEQPPGGSDGAPAVGLPTLVPETEQPGTKPKKSHFPVQDMFARPLGGVRTQDNKEQWTVREVQLVGLVTHRDPVVYTGGKVPDMKGGKDLPTRELDAFEKAALQALRGGEDLEVEKHDKSMRMLGPIYAGQRCVACHEEKGQMLGAFSFKLERTPVEAPKSPAPARSR